MRLGLQLLLGNRFRELILPFIGFGQTSLVVLSLSFNRFSTY